jgi:microcompartment protein CcmK/EutM
VILARVLGNVVGTVKHSHVEKLALFVVQPIEVDGSDAGESFLAYDRAQSGPGDIVLVLREGNGVRQIMKDPQSPIRCLIIGVVDLIDAPEGLAEAA